MDCPICETRAKEANARTLDGITVQCPECGEYDIARTVYKTGMLARLDLDSRHDALEKVKREAKPGKRPMITSHSF